MSTPAGCWNIAVWHDTTAPLYIQTFPHEISLFNGIRYITLTEPPWSKHERIPPLGTQKVSVHHQSNHKQLSPCLVN